MKIWQVVTIILIWTLLAIILSQVGLETKRFNSLIVEQVKKYNDDLIYFYKKNGYKEIFLDSINKYDDGENIYDLTPMDKYLTIR